VQADDVAGDLLDSGRRPGEVVADEQPAATFVDVDVTPRRHRWWPA
jgi:hypothetical protein